MKTELSPSFKQTDNGKLADKILRACVHCGFCNATCPTYQLLGDENDGPRGRIYQIKQMLEGKPVDVATRTHLDRCLTCRNCETTCPSGVNYSQLLDIGRNQIEKAVPRPFSERLKRRLLRQVLPHRRRFAALLKTGRLFRPFLPRALRRKIPRPVARGRWPAREHERRMLILDGCVQPAISPDTNIAVARVLNRLGISLIKARKAGCCGALSHHLSAEEEALQFMRRNIDAWWPEIETGVEAIVTTASGCGLMVTEYAHHLRNDPHYAEKAKKVSALCQDIAQVIQAEDLAPLKSTCADNSNTTVSWHPPCTLQHGLKINGVVEQILKGCGFQLAPVKDSHLCCGSAGTYSILQAELSGRLQQNKIQNLKAGNPELIVTANIGCQVHLQEASDVPVIHWIHLLDQQIS